MEPSAPTTANASALSNIDTSAGDLSLTDLRNEALTNGASSAASAAVTPQPATSTAAAGTAAPFAPAAIPSYPAEEVDGGTVDSASNGPISDDLRSISSAGSSAALGGPALIAFGAQ